MDVDMMDDNLWEAYETIYKEKGDKKTVERNLEDCLQRNYVKKARKFLVK